MTGGMKLTARVAALVLASAGLAACGGSGGGKAPASAQNVLSRGTASEPPTLDPHLAAGNSSSPIIDDLFTGLMTTNATGDEVDGIAQSHTVSEDG